MDAPAHRRIVILGGGFAGSYTAQALERRLRGKDVEIVLIDRNNYFIFYPLLVEAGTGSLEPRHAVVSIRSFLNTTVFRMADALGVDPQRREVRYQVAGAAAPATLRYDQLVLALGSVTNLPPVPGLREHGLEMKSLADAVALRDRAIRLLELADTCADADARRALLQFVVVGGNFTGVEVAGEFHVFLRHACRAYRNISPRECNVTLVELSDRILSALDPDLGDYALQQLRKRGINVLLRESVAEVHADKVVLRGGETIATRAVIWCAGIAPPPLLAAVPDLPLDERGYVLCERDLRVKGFDTLWALGDCAVNPDKQGRPYPATAQHAVRQAAVLAGNLARLLSGRPTVPCDIISYGSLVALGCRTGVAKVMGVKISGFTAWWLWRTVYLLKMPGWARKLRVALDWTMDLLFKRDFVQLGVHRALDRGVYPSAEPRP